jgi:hypothetical protein
MYADSIYENQIEKFSGAWKEKIDSSYMRFLKMVILRKVRNDQR